MDHRTWLSGGGGNSGEDDRCYQQGINPRIDIFAHQEQMPTMERGRDRIVKNLNEKLASVLLDIHAKDDLATKNVKMAPVADADTSFPLGREMAEADHAITLKKELDEALRQGKLANEKLYNSEAALKECMQQLNFVRDKQERRIRDTVAKTSREFEKAQEALQDKLTDANRRLEELTLENSRLSKALLVKEKLIEDKQKLKSQSEVEFSSLMGRLDLIEKENAFLKYEFHVLEKELEIRNEEMEYTRQLSDLAHKQHLQDVKKIAKLEVECQKLRLLLQKRLPGPAAMVKMKNEVEMLGKDKSEVRRRKPNPTRDLIVRGSTAENPPENPTKRINLLLEQLHNVEENKTLREIMTKKDAQIQSLCSMCSQTSSRPTTELKSRPKELFKGQKSMELIRNSPLSSELSVTSSFDIGSIDGNSSSCSWANALFSESAQLYKRLGNPIDHKAITVPEMRLMDDFLEMEKLALSDGKELVPFEQGHCGFSNTKQIQSKDVAGERYFDWLQIVLKAISEHKRISSRSLVEILEDIKIALGCGNLLNTPDVNKNECSMPPIEANAHHISSYIGWKSPNVSPSTGSLGRASSVDTSAEKTKDQQFQPSLSKSIGKIIKLIEGIGPTSSNSSKTCQEKNQTPKQSPTQADYFVCVFQWKSSELSTILQRFHRTCNDLLNKRADLETFAEELSFALDWIVNFCVTPKEASSARDKIKRHFGWNDSQSEIEVASASHTSAVEPDVTHTSKEQSSDSFASSPDQNRSVIPENEETKESIGRLQAELNMLKESKEMVEDQLENQKSINEYLDTQLIVAKAKLNEIFQKCSSLEVELEFKNNSCEELEATCLELQLQLESVAKKETLKFAMNREGKQSQKGREITAVSVKLAECQETILNLGKQLKVLASPQDAVLFDKVFSNSSTAAINRRVNKRLSLHDRMLVDDGGKATDIVMSPKIQEAEDSTLSDSNNCKKLQASGLLLDTSEAHCGSSRESTNAGVMALAIVPSKKQGVGLLRRLLFRRRKGYSKKPHYQN
ncbi:RING/U-box domain-containing protein isoform 1 [Hibiscus syriacus]|uniref:RING/U-box domain-containing protein isoform 1 n=1 Tax=Hibiscus syriacus TaxID=106335 RepID=A0A6A2XMB2_HIBSY|nr:RING/U-box domain-containing protein isoform 1 [Hibiscus syriacus]